MNASFRANLERERARAVYRRTEREYVKGVEHHCLLKEYEEAFKAVNGEIPKVTVTKTGRYKIGCRTYSRADFYVMILTLQAEHHEMELGK